MMVLPNEFERRMRTLLGDEWDTVRTAWETMPIRRGVRANRLKYTAEQLRERLPFLEARSPFSPDGFVTTASFRAGSDPLHHAGAYYVQEPSAMSAVTVLRPEKGERVLDTCAAPGGKSTQIAAALAGEGLLWCNEYVPSRARILAQNIERCGIRNAVVSAGDTARLPVELSGFFDAVLCDVPCSGEGMFRKEPEAIPQWSEDNVRTCAARSAAILDNAAACVRRGGRLVLSTCTFAPEENEWAVVRFLKRHPDFTLVDTGVTFGRPGFSADRIAPFGEGKSAENVPLQYCRRILPTDGGEGHFIALFVREGDEARPAVAVKSAKEPEAVSVARALYADCFVSPPRGRLSVFGDTARLLPEEMPETRGISIVAAGVAVATLRQGRTLRAEPHHAVFQSAAADDCRRVLNLSLDDARVTAFLHGEELAVESPDGYTALAVDGVVTGFGKVSGGKLKNHYPKGLRLL